MKKTCCLAQVVILLCPLLKTVLPCFAHRFTDTQVLGFSFAIAANLSVLLAKIFWCFHRSPKLYRMFYHLIMLRDWLTLFTPKVTCFFLKCLCFGVPKAALLEHVRRSKSTAAVQDFVLCPEAVKILNSVISCWAIKGWRVENDWESFEGLRQTFSWRIGI